MLIKKKRLNCSLFILFENFLENLEQYSIFNLVMTGLYSTIKVNMNKVKNLIYNYVNDEKASFENDFQLAEKLLKLTCKFVFLFRATATKLFDKKKNWIRWFTLWKKNSYYSDMPKHETWRVL
jgi:hypothetical protein